MPCDIFGCQTGQGGKGALVTSSKVEARDMLNIPRPKTGPTTENYPASAEAETPWNEPG